MKLKALDCPVGRFDLDSAHVTEVSVEILASNEKQKIKIYIDDVRHFRVTEESFSIDTFMDLTSEKEDNDMFSKQCFFEILDDRYSEWVLKESYSSLDKRYFKQYAFIFLESFVEVISSSPPIFSVIKNNWI